MTSQLISQTLELSQLMVVHKTTFIKHNDLDTKRNQDGLNKVKETNMFTVDKYNSLQIGFFPNERAFYEISDCGMLETNLKLPSRRLLLYVKIAYIHKRKTGGEHRQDCAFLGNWKGHSVTKRSGVYGATIAEADTVAF
ncbi:uncharacterized protein LOC116145428 [Pistacia vera]|uniref:uncharacterized protein LOC116145428 n=1 Tax=Pistacia vera TaxID=55513 RepID=UPI001263984F|nr:uncharacterized protein LOC116145428 [Pistacia vera]